MSEIVEPIMNDNDTTKNTNKKKKKRKILELIIKDETKIVDDTNIFKNIKDIRENKLMDINFKKCVKGYHLCNSSSINETMWEDLNGIVFSSSGIEMYSKSDGSHLSGMDINCSLGRISN